MKKFIFALAAAGVLSGCSLIKREAGYPGGNLGFLADRTSYFAAGQVETANRFLVAMALVVPLVDETVKTSSEARISAERVKELYKSVAKLEEAARKCPLVNQGGVVRSTCIGPNSNITEDSSFTFESISFEVVESLSDALEQSYDNLGIEGGVKNITSFDPGDVLETIIAARRLIPVLLNYLATYRDVIIIVGASINESCEAVKDTRNPAQTAACARLNTALNALIARKRTQSFDAARDEVPIIEVRRASRAVLSLGVRWTLSDVYRNALLQHVNRSCKRLDALAKVDDTDDFKGCTVSLVKTKSGGNLTTVERAVNEIQRP